MRAGLMNILAYTLEGGLIRLRLGSSNVPEGRETV